MQVLCTFGIKMLIFFEYMQVWWTSSPSNLHILKKIKNFDREKSPNLHILKKIKTFDSEKSPNLHILKKIKKNKNFRLYVGLTGIDELVFDFFDFFEYMQVWWLFTIIFLIFLSICRFCALLASTCWSFLSICRFGEPQVPQTCIYSKKMKNFDREKSPNLHILKKIKTFDSEKSPNLHILKKIKKNQTLCGTDWHRWISFWFFWFFWVYAGLVTFHYHFFDFFLSICRFCALLASKCWSFLSICRFCALLVVKIMHFLLLMQVLERYKSQNLQRVCHFEVNKAQIKTGIRFWFSYYFILLKNKIIKTKPIGCA